MAVVGVGAWLWPMMIPFGLGLVVVVALLLRTIGTPGQAARAYGRAQLEQMLERGEITQEEFAARLRAFTRGRAA